MFIWHMGYSLDGAPVDVGDISAFVGTHPDYLYTECIEPDRGLEKIQGKIHPLCVVAINETGSDPEIVGGYMRFPVDRLGTVNYVRGGAPDDYAYYMEVDFDTGFLSRPTAVFDNHAECMPIHPDTGYDLANGFQIEGWDEVVAAVKEVSSYIVGNEFVGFDIGVTDDGPKLKEINSLPGNMGAQWSRYAYGIDKYVACIRRKNAEIDALADERKAVRRGIK